MEVDPLKLLAALQLLCWYTGELEGHDVLTRASEHLKDQMQDEDERMWGDLMKDIIMRVPDDSTPYWLWRLRRLRRRKMNELTPTKADEVLAAQREALQLLLGRLYNKPRVGRVIL